MSEAGLLPPEDVETVFRRLSEAMPGRSERAKGPKGQPDAFRSCISCMLSAQSLDSNTAKASRALFALAQTPAEMLALSDAEIIEAIKPAGLYNNKARAIRKFCRQLLDEHDGVVPDTRKGLLGMYGIGRKCADIVLSFAFGEEAIAVDTHVGRVCDRIGLARGPTEAKIAEVLDKRAPDWAKDEGHFWLIQLGKRICKSRRPHCARCPVSDLCQYYAGGNGSDG
ncbi:MAG: endonuclease III domain-containing protein [Parasphingopyxis sp.]|uniref:endonuclease III domain-containing protein n=1 Tax=Parasphingopyxis sp. TaxID=1920299 RepID=UPI003F9F5549